MALADAAPALELRRIAALTLLACFVAAVVFADAAAVRTGYPFLNASLLRAPDIIYFPTFFPNDASGSSTRITEVLSGTEFEWTIGELRVWESTRYDASVAAAVGAVVDDGTVAGVLAVWHRARSADGRTRFLHARLGYTLVVISGTLSWDELLRVADSLRRTTPKAFIL